MKVYLLYSGNEWLSPSSLRLLAVCTNEAKAIELADLHSQEINEPLDEIAKDELNEQGDTSGRNVNYLICETDTDELEG